MSGFLRCFSPLLFSVRRKWDSMMKMITISNRYPATKKLFINNHFPELCTIACAATNNPSMKPLVFNVWTLFILLLVSLWKIELFIDYYLDIWIPQQPQNLFLSMDSIWISSLNICSLFNAMRIPKPWCGLIVVVCIYKFHQFMDIPFIWIAVFPLFLARKSAKIAKQNNNDRFFRSHIDANQEEYCYFTFIYSPLNWNWRHDANQTIQWTNTHTNRSQMKRTEIRRWNRETKWIKIQNRRENCSNSESNGTRHLKIRYSSFASKQPNELCSVLTHIFCGIPYYYVPSVWMIFFFSYGLWLTWNMELKIPRAAILLLVFFFFIFQFISTADVYRLTFMAFFIWTV